MIPNRVLIRCSQGSRSGCLAGYLQAIWISVFADVGRFPAKSWARVRYERPRLEKRYNNQRELAWETDPKA